MRSSKIYYNGTIVEFTDNQKKGLNNIEKANTNKKKTIKNPSTTLVEGFFYDTETGEQLKKKATFKMSFSVKMKIADAVCLQQQMVLDYNKNRKFKDKVFHCFLIATFPDGLYSEKECSTLFSAFLNRLTKKKQGVKSYVWIRELTQKGTPHYHFITIQKHIDITLMNEIWAKMLRIESKCCIRSSKDKEGRNRMVIRSKSNAIAYVLKYLSKTESKEINSHFKVTARSESLKIEPVTIKKDNGYAINEGLKSEYNSKRPLFKKEFTSIYSVKADKAHDFYSKIREMQLKVSSHIENSSLISGKAECSFAFHRKKDVFSDLDNQ